MASLLHVSGLLLGEKDINNERVKSFADKMTSYCEQNGEKARRMTKVLSVLNDEIMPMRNKFNEEEFSQIMEALRNKVLEIGGVTGFLPEVEGKSEIKKS